MNKTWLITGTSSGFGKYLATYLAQKGTINIVATARNTAQLDYLDQYDHGQIIKCTLDVTNKEQIDEVVKASIQAFNGIDVLVNNAGLGHFGTFEESKENAVKYMFDVNVWGVVDMTRAVLPTMRKQRSGIVVNISSHGGLCSYPSLSFYCGTKYAIEGIMDSMSQEVAEFGIKVMLVEPGGFRTDWAGRSSKKDIPTIAGYEKVANQIHQSEREAGHEAGDPQRAVEIIYDKVTNNNGSLPPHLPLGEFAIEEIIKKYDHLTQHFKSLKELAVSADQPEN